MSQRNTPRTKPNYLYAIISVALVLFLLGFFMLVVLQGQQLVKVAKERVEIIVELKPDTDDKATERLVKSLKINGAVKPGSVKLISKEEGAELMREEFGEAFISLDMPNPLYDVVTFNVRADLMQSDSLNLIKSQLKIEPNVSDVYYQENLVNQVAANIQRISWLALGLGVFLLAVAFMLIYNTIRLALYANRFLIKNMELVGASWEFISRPYLWRSLLHGIIAAIIAIAGLFLLLFWAQNLLPELKQLQSNAALTILSGTLLFIGVFITTLSTWFVVNKYLKMRVDDLY